MEASSRILKVQGGLSWHIRAQVVFYVRNTAQEAELEVLIQAFKHAVLHKISPTFFKFNHNAELLHQTLLAYLIDVKVV